MDVYVYFDGGFRIFSHPHWASRSEALEALRGAGFERIAIADYPKVTVAVKLPLGGFAPLGGTVSDSDDSQLSEHYFLPGAELKKTKDTLNHLGAKDTSPSS